MRYGEHIELELCFRFVPGCFCLYVGRACHRNRTMASSPTQTEGLLGSIVAFEGKSDIVSTQLRLLPTSPQLLILPSVESYIKARADEQHECFDARSYIRKVHDALIARVAAARSFLNEATTGHKHLVFVNGGTPGAQALCVREIMRYETHGDRSEAEAIFDEIIKEGVAGLERLMSNHGRQPRYKKKSFWTFDDC